jgi:ABC-2 type transport system ATP-binding protein
VAVLEVRDLVRRFGARSNISALSAVTFDIGEGETVGLLGENGAGKTTLLKVIATLLLPTSGAVRVCGFDVVERPRAVRKHLGVVFGGERGLYNRLSGLDNLIFFGGLSGLRRGLRSRAHEALARVGLDERSHVPVEEYSRGMRQRLHLAVGLMVTPRLLLLDEPTIGLDVLEAQRIRETIRRLVRTGVSVLLTSHNPVDIEQLADRVVMLHKGLITHDMPIRQFRQRAGMVAEVHLRGRGEPPTSDPATNRVVVATSSRANTWTLTQRVRAWEPDVLSGLARTMADRHIDDIEISTVGVETVLKSLYEC